MGDPHLPRLQGDAVIARCHRCSGAVTAFNPVTTGSSSVFTQTEEWSNGDVMVTYMFVRCSACGTGAVATLVNDFLERGPLRLHDFHPHSPDFEALPQDAPMAVVAEVREAEWAASVGAFRAATALLRSALEKVLKSNGYVAGVLATKIDDAAADGIITASRKRQVHEDVRHLGNDVVHDEWRQVTLDEYELARKYVTWILEDFYADRPTVVSELKTAGRLS